MFCQYMENIDLRLHKKAADICPGSLNLLRKMLADNRNPFFTILQIPLSYSAPFLLLFYCLLQDCSRLFHRFA